MCIIIIINHHTCLGLNNRTHVLTASNCSCVYFGCSGCAARGDLFSGPRESEAEPGHSGDAAADSSKSSSNPAAALPFDKSSEINSKNKT